MRWFLASCVLGGLTAVAVISQLPPSSGLTPWQEATYTTIQHAQRSGEIALKQGDRAAACVQGKIQVSAWLSLAGSLPAGSQRQLEAEDAYRKMTEAVQGYCGF
jgi:hypothetical protein